MKKDEYRLPDKLAFQNIEAERSCLGAALQDERSVNRLKEMSIEDFTSPEHRVLYSSILDNNARGLPIDLVTMHATLSEQNKLENVGGDKYLMDLIREVPSTVNMPYYIRLVQECTSRRKLKSIGEELIRKSGYLDEEVESLREFTVLSVRSVKGTGSIKLISQKDAVMRTIEKIGNSQRKEGKPNDRIITGITPLDKMTGGLYGSKLIVIGARPSVGKSVFALAICMKAAAQGKKVLYISLEMGEDEVVEREFAADSLVPLAEITSDNISEDSWKKLAESFAYLSTMPVYYCTDIRFVEEVRKAAFTMYENGGIDLICVDYIQLLKAQQKRYSRQEEVADISRSLKALAQELNVPVIALSQLNRDSQRENRPPTMSEARESGAIEQDANIFILLHEPDIEEIKSEDFRSAYTALAEEGMKLLYINVDKNRQGKKGVFYIAFDGSHMRFLPIKREQ